MLRVIYVRSVAVTPNTKQFCGRDQELLMRYVNQCNCFPHGFLLYPTLGKVFFSGQKVCHSSDTVCRYACLFLNGIFAEWLVDWLTALQANRRLQVLDWIHLSYVTLSVNSLTSTCGSFCVSNMGIGLTSSGKSDCNNRLGRQDKPHRAELGDAVAANDGSYRWRVWRLY